MKMYLYKNHDETVNFCKYFDGKEKIKIIFRRLQNFMENIWLRKRNQRKQV